MQDETRCKTSLLFTLLVTDYESMTTEMEQPSAASQLKAWPSAVSLVSSSFALARTSVPASGVVASPARPIYVFTNLTRNTSQLQTELLPELSSGMNLGITLQRQY